MSDEYELTLMKLENQVEEQKETIQSLEASGKSVQPSPSTDHTFDAALKSHLTDSEALRNNIKTKNEEILQLKVQLE
jgi:predicted RNase H-like nuclease (RuvC/YqgF family)